MSAPKGEPNAAGLEREQIVQIAITGYLIDDV
jgi:hypothetical protein